MTRVTLMVVSVLLACGNAVAQPNGGFAEAWRTSWGDPDLRGRWTNTTTTPMQRPDEYEGRAELTNEERAELDARANSRGDRTPPPGSTGAYNSFWVDRGTRTTQTSLVVDPPDGRWPALTNRVRARDAALTASRECRTRLVYGPESLRPVYHAWRARCHDSRVLQPQLPDSSNARLRRYSCRDDSRRAHHPAGWATPSVTAGPSVDGRFAWPLGG